MTGTAGFAGSLARSRATPTSAGGSRVFALAGREWDLLDGVFAPTHSATTLVAMELLGLADGGQDFRRRGSFLEIGSGTGVIAVSAALAGCDRVVATDINPAAARNTALNARRHGLAGRLTALQGDLFETLGAHERFDTVYWHSNYVLAPAGYRYEADIERAYVDPGYRAHRRYLSEAPGLVAPGGAALLQFSERGDLGLLRRLADECGRTLRPLRRRRLREGAADIELTLYEICVNR
ncbi:MULTISPECIES: methyltransferase domain-containing protein [unclassified Streptomyces]|uniref:methyltransferase domain-containing protein n=1 Tax=unclassified Streptomyces TaxID=2593676 RepID=UPI000CD4C7FD|nr:MULTISPECIES: 50S ribosomal protein L11 methyltransferase [unclassified Streptomyces]